MDIDEKKKHILEELEKKTKAKSKFYLKDFYKFLPEDKPRAIKNINSIDWAA